ncbi:MAG: hypothetical protein KKH77_07085 [Candidatus Omnitrophica bacterium]|nr:hypothetical protein [Candidatus Omnitrophota bacterium]MBU1808143.1 hypothetical protein [Candidatus Omnitrophota bacterium]
MPEAPAYSFDTPLGKIKIQCRKDDSHFYCHVNSPFYKNEIKFEKAKLTEGVLKFVEWLK